MFRPHSARQDRSWTFHSQTHSTADHTSADSRTDYLDTCPPAYSRTSYDKRDSYSCSSCYCAKASAQSHRTSRSRCCCYCVSRSSECCPQDRQTRSWRCAVAAGAGLTTTRTCECERVNVWSYCDAIGFEIEYWWWLERRDQALVGHSKSNWVVNLATLVVGRICHRRRCCWHCYWRCCCCRSTASWPILSWKFLAVETFV